MHEPSPWRSVAATLGGILMVAGVVFAAPMRAVYAADMNTIDVKVDAMTRTLGMLVAANNSSTASIMSKLGAQDAVLRTIGEDARLAKAWAITGYQMGNEIKRDVLPVAVSARDAARAAATDAASALAWARTSYQQGAENKRDMLPVLQANSAAASKLLDQAARAVQRADNTDQMVKSVKEAVTAFRAVTIQKLDLLQGAGAGGGETVARELVEEMAKLTRRVADEMCANRPEQPWWKLDSGTVYGTDAGCDTDRRDLREVSDRASDDAARIVSAVKVVDATAKALAAAQQAQSREVAEQIARNAAKIVEAIKEKGTGAAPETGNSLDSWNSTPGGLSGKGWGAGLSCLAPSVPEVSMCGFGPKIELGGGVTFQPLSYCGDMSSFAPWKAVFGAVLIISATWLSSKWVLGALGVATPTETST